MFKWVTENQQFLLKIETPGPGTYGEGGVPHAAMEAKDKKSASTVGILDAGASTPRNLPAVVCIFLYEQIHSVRRNT